jgi:hypothetical protein
MAAARGRSAVQAPDRRLRTTPDRSRPNGFGGDARWSEDQVTTFAPIGLVLLPACAWGRLMTDERTRRRGPGSSPTATACSVRPAARERRRSGRGLGWAPASCMPHRRRSGHRARKPCARRRGAAWRGVADQWEELADAAVPPELDGAAEAVEALETLHGAVMAGESGGRAGAAAETAAIRIATPTPSATRPHRGDPRGSRRPPGAIYQAEVDALDMTAGPSADEAQPPVSGTQTRMAPAPRLPHEVRDRGDVGSAGLTASPDCELDAGPEVRARHRRSVASAGSATSSTRARASRRSRAHR